MADNVFNLDDYRSTANPTTDSFSSRQTATPTPSGSNPSVRIQESDNGSDVRSTGKYTSPSRLYPLGESQRLGIQRSIKLIEEAEAFASTALDALKDGDTVASELAI